MRAVLLSSGLTVIALACTPGGVNAADSDRATSFGLSLKLGTVGVGADLAKSFGEYFKVRGGWSGLTYNGTYKEDAIDYKVKLKLGGWNLLADYHPFGSGFRLTAGAFGPAHELAGDGQFSAAGGTVTINGTQYSQSDLDRLRVSARWRGARPYAGLGYDGFNASTNGGFYFSFDAGVIFAGKPDLSLTATCTNAGLCSQLESDIAAERAKLESDLKNARYLPVLQIGVGYRF